MVKIERNKPMLIFMFVLLAVVLVAFMPIMIDIFRPDPKIDVIIWTVIGVLVFSLVIHYIVVSYREYELNASGITIYGILHWTKHFSWKDFPYCYIMWVRGTGAKIYSLIVLSKTEIDVKQAKKIGNRGQFFSKPYSVITFLNTRELEKEIRSAFPELKIEYRNTSLAKREREGW